MYNVKVNDNYNFSVSAENKEIKVNDEVITLDSVPLKGASHHILYKNKSYTVEIVMFDKAEKTATIKVNGTIYTLALTDQFDLLLQQLGMDNLAATKILQIKAPMPGLVLSVLVAEGNEVKKGDSILVLEAMKMENMIKSPSDGTIKKIAIKQGDKVEKNEVLISFH
ncbi:MAG: acetyl-CoA carboxylase biotin carboxyl carrier protein subunit [Bacteroidota bacterium]